MGNRIPVPDERMQRVIDSLQLKKKHVKILWTCFSKHDKDKSGTIDVEEFYKLIHEKRSIFVDGIFEIVDVDTDGTLDFGEFCQALATYCMFEVEEILKYCFFVFDRDKNGYIEQDELLALLNMLHENNIDGNLQTGLEMFDMNKDGKVDFQEFKKLNRDFPQLLYPAFRIQCNMMRYTFGQPWWEKRKTMLNAMREEMRNRTERLRIAEQKRLDKVRRKKVRKEMGVAQFYIMRHRRKIYEAKIPRVEVEGLNTEPVNEQELALKKEVLQQRLKEQADERDDERTE